MACFCKPPRKDFYIRESDFTEDFQANQCIITREAYLKHISGLQYDDKEEYVSPTPVDWYPHANSYYPFAEDVDPLERVNHLLGTKPSFVSLNSFYAESDVKEIVYSEKNAQQNYLESTPVSFIILCKPGIGEEQLGKRLADYWQCVYIEPSVLIRQEIENNSRAGQCIEFNLRCGRAIGIDVILRLVEKRINSDTSKHRGFVICGLPVIPNLMYKEDQISSESAVFTVKDIFEEVLDAAVELGVPPPSRPQVSVSSKYADKPIKGEGASEDEILEAEEPGEGAPGEGGASPTFRQPVELPPTPPLDTGPDYDVCHAPEISNNYEEQLNFLFNLLKPPFLIIYIICNAKDVIKKRENEKFDIYSKLDIDLLLESTNEAIFNYFTKNKADIESLPADIYESYIHDTVVEYQNLKHLVSLPKNFPINVESQLDSYHYTAMNFIERRIMTHDPQYFVKLDGRTSIRRMFHVLKSKMNSLPLQKVLIPERIFMDSAAIGGEGSSPVEENPEEQISFQEHFEKYRKIGTPAVAFRWGWSDWGTKCPVALRNGILKDGNVKYAVHFFNKIFYLSDEESLFTFYRNPRPYLLHPYPKPTCKIFVFGPKCSGKTIVSNCLAYLLNGIVLSTASIVENFIEQKEHEFKEKVRQASLVEGLAILNDKRKTEAEDAELKRANDIKDWLTQIKTLVDEYEKYTEELQREIDKTNLEVSSFPMAMVKETVAEIETETTIAIKKVRDQLVQLNLPDLPLNVCQQLVQDKQKLLNYLPDNLKKKIHVKPATVHDEFVINYVNEAVAKAIFVDDGISTQNIVEMIKTSIKEVEARYAEQGNNCGGWIIDGMICDVAVLQELYPDYIADDIIILKDTEDFQFLRKRFKKRGANVFRDYRNFFLKIGKVDAAWRAPSQILSTTSFRQKFGRSIISEILDDARFDGKTAAGNLIRDETYYEDLLKHKIKWIEVEEYFKSIAKPILEVDVTNKSLTELLTEAIRVLEDEYRVKASLFTEEDRAAEVLMYSSDMVAEEGAEEPASPVDVGVNIIEKNRRYGNTYHYCPVTYNDKFVLWRGKDNLAVKFEDQVYFLATEEDKEYFLKFPRKCLVDKPPNPKSIPPPRICVVGLPNTGKTDLSRALSLNYGISYISFQSLLKKYFHIETDETFEDLKNSETINSTLSVYLNGSDSLPEEFYSKYVCPLWFDYPTRELGFVIDDFPKRPADVPMMIKYKLIPDLIINLDTNEFQIKNKMLEVRLAEWQANMLIKRALFDQLNKDTLMDWQQKREIRYKEMLEERRQNRFTEKKKIKIKNLDETEKDNLSEVSFDSVAEQRDMDEINRLLDLEIPVISAESPEKYDETKLSYETQINNHVNSEMDMLKVVRTACEAELIPYTSIPIDLDDYHKNERSIFYHTQHVKFRTHSFFERCYDVSMEVADRLLSTGYYFLSKFGKLCPVQYYKNKNPFIMYQFMGEKYAVFPIIHRSYIYFPIGRENAEEFRKHPLKYLKVETINFPILPIRIAVSGPPKCGKTTLSKRIQREYGMKLITRGQAIRFVLAFLPFSNLAINIESVLRKGWEATDEMVARCVEAASIDPWGVTQGVIYDGFPDTISELRHLSYLGLVPQLVIDLQATKRQSFECLENDVGRRGFPRYSLKFVNQLYKQYSEVAEAFQPWFDREYQVTHKISIETSNWSVWDQTNKVLTAVFFEIKHYYIYCHQDWPLRLGNMQVTPLEFLERQSSYKIFCPCCLHFSNKLTSGGDVPDRTGLVQWRQYYYWLCDDHVELFLKTPEAFLPPYTANALPQHLPTRLHLKIYPQNLFEDGTCIVCYKNKTIIIKGILNYAVDYNYKTYLFDRLECLEEFMQQPNQFSFDIKFRPPENYSTLEYSELPALGMLEQYVAKDLIKAVIYISRRRPVIPGLSVAASAAIGIGLYLKVFDKAIPAAYKERYLQGDELFHSRREMLVECLDRLKHIINPYLHYEEPLPKFKMLSSVKSSLSSSSDNYDMSSENKST